VTPTLDILRETFGPIGAASVLAWAAAAVLLLAGTLSRRRWTARLAGLAAAAAAVGLAAIASEGIRAIEIDRSAELAAAEAAGAKKVEARFRSRAAQVRFAEDTAADEADLAGVAEAEQRAAAERAVAEELAKVPAYRSRGRQPRGNPGSGAVPSSPGGGQEPGAAEDGGPAAESGPAVRSLPEPQLLIADRFDRLNRAVAWSLLALAFGMCGLEYIRRYNSTVDAVWTLPLAGTVLDGLTAKEHVGRLPADRLAEFLILAVRKGESFLVFAPHDPCPDRAALDRFGIGPFRWTLPKRTFPAAALAADPGLLETVFETAWFGRGCFVIAGADGADATLAAFVVALVRRSRTRAAARRTLAVVWALPTPPPPAAGDDLEHLAARLNVRWLRT